jgi:hypothetical protein
MVTETTEQEFLVLLEMFSLASWRMDDRHKEQYRERLIEFLRAAAGGAGASNPGLGSIPAPAPEDNPVREAGRGGLKRHHNRPATNEEKR